MNRFTLGRIEITGQAQIILDFGLNEAKHYLERHVSYDWGIVNPRQARLNKQNLSKTKSRVISVYQTPQGAIIAIVTRYWKGQAITRVLTRKALEADIGRSIHDRIDHSLVKVGIRAKYQTSAENTPKLHYG